jgi:hypothetical protein
VEEHKAVAVLVEDPVMMVYRKVIEERLPDCQKIAYDRPEE